MTRQTAQGIRKVRLYSALMLLCSGMVQALPSQTFRVSALVVAGCVISSVSKGVFGKLDFGTQSGVARGMISTRFVPNAGFTLSCTPGTTLNMSIDGGSHYSVTRNLKLVNDNAVIGYQIFTGASLHGASAIPVNQSVGLNYSNANTITLPVYGLLQLNKAAPAGTYTDTLMVTLNW